MPEEKKFKAPSFPLYVSRFLVDTAEMDESQVGIYIRLLCYQWENGSIPSGSQVLARLAGCTLESLERGWPEIKKRFEVDGERLVNRFMENVRFEKEELYGKLAAAGRYGAEQKKKKRDERKSRDISHPKSGDSTPEQPNTITITNNDSLQESNSIPVTETEKKVDGTGKSSAPPVAPPPPQPELPLPDGGKGKLVFYDYDQHTSCYPFMQFWKDYGKKVDKELALKKYRSVEEEDRALIKLHIPKYKKAQPNPKFRRDPCTYINRRSWENEIYADEQTGAAGMEGGERAPDSAYGLTKTKPDDEAE